MARVEIYDCTLRDGCQAEGVAFSTDDKLAIVQRLDELGVHYIEAGQPGANPKDMEVFDRLRRLRRKKAKIAAFCGTHHARKKPKDDPGLRGVLKSRADVATIFGKSWRLHVTDVLRTSAANNLKMIEGSVAYLRKKGLPVIYDAEHFFDGFQDDPEYAIETLRAALRGGAMRLVLCDTCGGTMPVALCAVVDTVKEQIDAPLGIHCHDDAGCAVANSILAVELGVTQVQGTINGYGERCGNANLCSIIPGLVHKLGIGCISKPAVRRLTELSRFVSETANLAHNERQAYVGASSFAHKGGMHVDGVLKNPQTFEHLLPEAVGNRRRLLVSDLAGRGMIVDRAADYAGDLRKDTPEIRNLFDELRRLEKEGYQFEGAEGSFKLLLLKAFGRHRELFHRSGFRVIVEKREDGTVISEATIKLGVGDRVVHTAAEGHGPIDALDHALRKALREFYPEIRKFELTDYKVRVLGSASGTASRVRVLIESTDQEDFWGTVGVSENIMEASWQALVDSMEYGLLHKKALLGKPKRKSRRRKRS